MPTMTTFIDLWDHIRDIIEVESNRFDRKWIIRKRLINTKLLAMFIFQLVLSKNTCGYGTILTLLWKDCSDADLPLLASKPVSPSSICEARQKLSENVFINIQDKIIECWEKDYSECFLWNNHRVFTNDGSKLHLPRELIEDGYETPGKDAYYPQGLLSCLYRAGCALPYAWNFTSHGDERKSCIDLLKKMRAGDILILDRGYYSFELLSECKARGIIPLFRLASHIFKKKRVGNKSDDYIITVYPTGEIKKKIKDKKISLNIDPIKLRIVNYRVKGTEMTLGTLLLDDKYTKDSISKLYWARWGEEELYKVSKQIIEVEDFHSKTERGVKQELYAHFVLITLTRISAIQAEIGLNSLDKLDPSIFDNNISKHEETEPVEKTEDLSKDKAVSSVIENYLPPLSLGIIKINFKAAISLLGENIKTLVMTLKYSFQTILNEFFDDIEKLKYKFRPLRSFPRVSRKPETKWRLKKH